ncbi:Gfo/Idh/MocA family protein [Niabella beijingensis]|uniref:Gfo/Idh/MocA family protein n=1 Tax=Niabella beijingensis TaxID=2872700 RepID=UPI001CC13689|nr:Gfo/Idh/MocA family oxidoreductase [Niabella beijingensis]MBZ4190233.1 Gfo/Idh/MocA family oxidoreductase [Niabella beijingensis]
MNTAKTIQRLLLFVALSMLSVLNAAAQQPVRLAIAGITHGHSDWIYNSKHNADIEIVGIYETNADRIREFRERYKLPETLFYSDLGKMLDEVKPEGVMAFGPVNEHITAVRAGAPRRIPVMVEKPLATTYKDALEIERLAKQYGIKVLTNFETSWYASNQYVRDCYKDGRLGQLRKVIVNDGHEGPWAMNRHFVSWLTDPVKNGGGALTDFGCYGANLMTWLMEGQRPVSVTAVTHQNRPDRYPKVEDEATIILQYPELQCVIQASWSWTFSRKDMEVYGTKGYAIAVDATTVRSRLNAKEPETTQKLARRPPPFEDPFAVFAGVIRGTLKQDPDDLYELPVNVTVVEILDAARTSARSGKTVYLKSGTGLGKTTIK